MTTVVVNDGPTRKTGKRRARIWQFFSITALLSILAVEAGGNSLLKIMDELPDVSAVQKYDPAIATKILDADGEVVAEYYAERRRIVNLKDIPQHVIDAFLAAEDAEYYKHGGLDFPGIARAAYANAMEGRIRQGGSTITQQLVRYVMLSQDRTFERKIREALLALDLESKMSKDAVLCKYLNVIYLGSGAYGVEEAAHTYFGVPARDLSLAQGAMLAGLVQGPSRLSPRHNLEGAKSRQRWVLGQMMEHGFVTTDEAKEALKEKIVINHSSFGNEIVAPYYVEEVRRRLIDILGEDEMKRGGYTVYTSLDRDLQRMAELSVKRGIERYDRGLQGWKVALEEIGEDQREVFLARMESEIGEKVLEPGDEVTALVTDYSRRKILLKVGERDAIMKVRNTPWRKSRRRRSSSEIPIGSAVKARVISNGDYLELEPVHSPELEGALVCVDPTTRQVKALVGGHDFFRSQFNRATQSRRPPGSAMKPLVYSAAYSTRKWNPTSVIFDTGAAFAKKDGINWRPKNYSRRHYGATSLHDALTHSRNVVTARLAYKIGIERVIDRAHLFGLNEDFPEVLSISLGCYGVSLLELTNAYSVFASGGIYQEPLLITHIVDRNGKVVYGRPGGMARRVISTGEAFQMTHALSYVVSDGTGRRAQGIGRKSAGKTGTTSDYRDAWYVGYTPELVTGVWVGRDDFSPISGGATGGRAALPIWVDFMEEALKDKPETWFEAPDDVYMANVVVGAASRTVTSEGDDGKEKVSETVVQYRVTECFLKGTRPYRYRGFAKPEEEDVKDEDKDKADEEKDKDGEDQTDDEDKAVLEAVAKAGDGDESDNDQEPAQAGDDEIIVEYVEIVDPWLTADPKEKNKPKKTSRKKRGAKEAANKTETEPASKTDSAPPKAKEPPAAPEPKPAKTEESKKDKRKKFWKNLVKPIDINGKTKGKN